MTVPGPDRPSRTRQPSSSVSPSSSSSPNPPPPQILLLLLLPQCCHGVPFEDSENGYISNLETAAIGPAWSLRLCHMVPRTVVRAATRMSSMLTCCTVDSDASDAPHHVRSPPPARCPPLRQGHPELHPQEAADRECQRHVSESLGPWMMCIRTCTCYFFSTPLSFVSAHCHT